MQNEDRGLAMSQQNGLQAKVDNAMSKLQKRLDQSVKAIEEAKSLLADAQQLANLDLQNLLQRQQQALQLISNISKQIQDTNASIIRKLSS